MSSPVHNTAALPVQRAAPYATAEDPPLAELAILDYLLDETIRLRLCHYRADGVMDATGDAALKKALVYSITIQRLLDQNKALASTRKTLHSQIAASSNDVFLRRKNLARFLGSVFFNAPPNCNSSSLAAVHLGACCAAHRGAGLKLALELFPMIVAAPGKWHVDMYALLVDLRTQLVVYGSKTAREFVSNCEVYLRPLSLAERPAIGPTRHAVYRRRLEARYHEMMECQHLVKAAWTAIESKFPRRLFEANTMAFLRDIYADFEAPLLRKFSENAPALMRQMRTTATSKDGALDQRGRSADKSAEVGDKPKQLPVSQHAPEMEHATICGALFRSTLVPNDEELAAIIEKRHPAIVEYLSMRKEHFKQPDGSDGSAAEVSLLKGKKSLLSAHDTAERIEWSSQPTASIDRSVSAGSPSRKKRRRHAASQHSTDQHGHLAPSAIQSPPQLTRLAPAADFVDKPTVPRVSAPRAVRKRRFFLPEETENLLAGMRRFGNHWQRILESYKFDGRSAVDLKDKARNLRAKGII